MKLTMVQMSMRNNMNENYKKCLQYIEEAAGSDLLFFPQLQFSPYFPQMSGLNATVALSRQNDARIKGMAYQAGKHHMCISPNVYLEDHGKPACASLFFDKSGEMKEVAEQIHRFNQENRYEKDYFLEGRSGFVVHDAGFAKIGIVIGNDRLFPESVRCCALRGAEIVIVPGAISMDEDLEMMQWEMRVQAKENQVFIAVCNRVGKEGRLVFAGHSFVASPDGSMLQEADDQEQLLRVNVDIKGWKQKKFSYLEERCPVYYGVLAQGKDNGESV